METPREILEKRISLLRQTMEDERKMSERLSVHADELERNISMFHQAVKKLV